MGKYRGAVITTAGQNLIAEAIASSGTITWTTAEASSYAYPAGTNFEALTSLQDVEQTAAVSSVGVFSDDILQVTARFDNDGVETAFLIETIGLYAQLGSNTPVLVAVVAADTPDQMPVESVEAPSAFVYNVQMTVQNADQIAVTVNPAGTATATDLMALQGRVEDLETEMPDKAKFSNLAYVESTNVASRNYATGNYLVYNGTVYRAIADIATGDTLTVGTNIRGVTIGGDLSDFSARLPNKSDLRNIAGVEATSTASQAYTKGSYLVYNGVLYQASAPIASGATLTPGTNITAVSVGNQLSLINALLAQAPSNMTMTTGASVTMGNQYSRFSPLSKMGYIMALFSVGVSQPSIPLVISASLGSTWSGGGIIISYTATGDVYTIGSAYRFTVQSNGRIQTQVGLPQGNYIIIGAASCAA